MKIQFCLLKMHFNLKSGLLKISLISRQRCNSEISTSVLHNGSLDMILCWASDGEPENLINGL